MLSDRALSLVGQRTKIVMRADRPVAMVFTPKDMSLRLADMTSVVDEPPPAFRAVEGE